MSLPSNVSRQPLLRVVPPDMEDEVLARFFQRSCSLADLAHFTGCTIRAISKWFEREDVQADLQRIARFAQGRTGYLLQESTHLVMQNHEHLMGLLGSDKFHYANSTTQARMMETARKAGNDLNKLRQDLDPSRPPRPDPCHDLSRGKVVRQDLKDRDLSPGHTSSTSRADFTSRDLTTSRDRQGAGELPSAHNSTKQLHPAPPATRAEPIERSSPIPTFKPDPIPDQHISEDAIARTLSPSDDPMTSDPAPSPTPSPRTPSPEPQDPSSPPRTLSPSPEGPAHVPSIPSIPSAPSDPAPLLRSDRAEPIRDAARPNPADDDPDSNPSTQSRAPSAAA